jgi:hypothetical protein
MFTSGSIAIAPPCPPAPRRRGAALGLAVLLLALAGCGDGEEVRLDHLRRAGVIAVSDLTFLRDDLRAGGVRAAEARHDIEMFSRSREALAGAGFPDLGAALGRLDTLRASGAIGGAEADRLKSALVAVWDAPAVSSAARRVSWLESRTEALRGEPPASRKDEAAMAVPAAPERQTAAGCDDAAARAMRRIDGELATALARDLLSPALAHALERAASSGDGRAAVEARLDHLLAPRESPPAIPAPADATPEATPSTPGENQ